MLSLLSSHWLAWRNALGFGVRRSVRWSLGPPRLRQEAKGGLFDYLEGDARAAAEAREVELRERYTLDPLQAQSRRIDYLENLYLLDALEAALPELELPDDARVLDVGSKNWSYVFALQRYFTHSGAARLELHGVEVDAHVVYWTLRSRYDLAQAYMAQTGAERVRFWAADVRKLDLGPCDLVTWFYPFFTREALLRWGLPLELLRPEETLASVRDCVRPGGWLLVVTHTPAELKLLDEVLPAGLTRERTTPIQSKLVPYWPRTQGRHATLLRREESRR